MRNSPLVTHHFKVNQCARQSQWMWNGREWGEVSAASLHQTVCHSQLPSLLRQNDKTSGECLSLPIGRMDSAVCNERARAWWGVCERRMDGQTRMWVGASPSCPRSSLSHHAVPPPAWRWLTGPVWSQNTDGRATQYTAALAGHRAFDCTRRRRCCNTTTTNSSTL